MKKLLKKFLILQLCLLGLAIQIGTVGGIVGYLALDKEIKEQIVNQIMRE